MNLRTEVPINESDFKNPRDQPLAAELLDEIGRFTTTIPLGPIPPSDDPKENELWIRRRAVLTRALFEIYPEHEAALACIHEYWMLMDMQPHLFFSVGDHLSDRRMEVTGLYRSYNFRDSMERQSWIEARETLSSRKRSMIEKVLAEYSHLMIANWAHDTIIEELRSEVLDFEPSDRSPKELLSIVNRLFSSVKRFLEFRNTLEALTKNELYPDHGQISLFLAEESLLDAVEVLACVDVKEQLRFLTKTERMFPENSRVQEVRRKLEAVDKTFDLAFTDLISGKQIELSEYAGNVVLIDFWATWCQPCLNQVPQLNRLIKRYYESGLRVIGISLDEPNLIKHGKQYIRLRNSNEELVELETHVLMCAENHNMDWPICVNKDLADRWGVKSIPTIFAIDRRGVLRSTNVAGVLSSTIAELLEE